MSPPLAALFLILLGTIGTLIIWLPDVDKWDDPK